MNRIKKVLIGTGIVATAIAMSSTAAEAAQWNSISGSDSTAWYFSTNLRHVTTANDTIQIQLNSFPSGQEWEVENASNGNIFGGPISISNTAAHTLCTGVLDGTTFYNGFKASSSGSFSGSEYY